MVSSIYKGSYYQCIVRTDDYYDFFVDTDDDWLKGDRVGINIAPEKIMVEKREVSEDGEDAAPEAPAPVADQTLSAEEQAAASESAAPAEAEKSDAEVTE